LPPISTLFPYTTLFRSLMPRTSRPLQIHKFGGASLANGAAIAHAMSIVQSQRPAPLVVVVSAMAGVTDALLEIASRAVHGKTEHTHGAVEALRAKHAEAARALLPAGARLDETLGSIDGSFAELEPLAAGLAILP